MNTEKRNRLVTAKTVLMYVKREPKQAYAKMVHKSLTIRRFQINIQMPLEDPKLKNAVACEVTIRECKKELSLVGKRLHDTRVDRNILGRYAEFKLRLHQQTVRA